MPAKIDFLQEIEKKSRFNKRILSSNFLQFLSFYLPLSASSSVWRQRRHSFLLFSRRAQKGLVCLRASAFSFVVCNISICMISEVRWCEIKNHFALSQRQITVTVAEGNSAAFDIRDLDLISRRIECSPIKLFAIKSESSRMPLPLFGCCWQFSCVKMSLKHGLLK